jgi:hypothetical protein
MLPDERDYPDAVAGGDPVGVKRAAVRKLAQELGVPAGAVPAGSFKFLTRLHYFAADTVTHGGGAPWGEHEIDYVLFALVDRGTLPLAPNPEEVEAVRWVGRAELAEAMGEGLWSPWFRIIANRWLLPAGGWWEDLKATMGTDRHVDVGTIHRFDPPEEHLGGAGGATAFLDELASPAAAAAGGERKQGAYGKVKTHKEGKLSQLMRGSEVLAAATLLYVRPLKSNLEHPLVRDKYVARGTEGRGRARGRRPEGRSRPAGGRGLLRVGVGGGARAKRARRRAALPRPERASEEVGGGRERSEREGGGSSAAERASEGVVGGRPPRTPPCGRRG